jgi:hypothetical protein
MMHFVLGFFLIKVRFVHLLINSLMVGNPFLNNMDTGLGTLAKISFDSLAKSAYTFPDEGKDQFLFAQ